MLTRLIIPGVPAGDGRKQMGSKQTIRVRKTNAGWHPYTATMRGCGAYGFGNTPDEARAKLLELIERFAAEKQAA